MTGMTSTEAKEHIETCRHMLDNADSSVKDEKMKLCIGALIVAIDQLADVVDDLSQRQQGQVIE